MSAEELAYSGIERLVKSFKNMPVRADDVDAKDSGIICQPPAPEDNEGLMGKAMRLSDLADSIRVVLY